MRGRELGTEWTTVAEARACRALMWDGHGFLYQADQHLAVDRLLQQGKSAFGHYSFAGIFFRKCRDEDHRRSATRGEQTVLKVLAVRSRHLKIRNQACRPVTIWRIQKLLSGFESARGKAQRRHQVFDRRADGFVVVNDRYNAVFKHVKFLASPRTISGPMPEQSDTGGIWTANQKNESIQRFVPANCSSNSVSWFPATLLLGRRQLNAPLMGHCPDSTNLYAALHNTIQEPEGHSRTARPSLYLA
jgi:hypothetical protein